MARTAGVNAKRKIGKGRGGLKVIAGRHENCFTHWQSCTIYKKQAIHYDCNYVLLENFQLDYLITQE